MGNPVDNVIHLLCWGQFPRPPLPPPPPRKAISVLSFPKLKLLLHFLACPNMQVLRGSSGVITSPNYPGNYYNNHRCSWKITGRSGDRVKLVIQSASIEGGGSCPWDYIQIQNGYLQSTGLNPGKICGYLSGTMTLISSRETLIVYFHTDGSVTLSGFRAIYTILRNGK